MLVVVCLIERGGGYFWVGEVEICVMSSSQKCGT